MNYDTDIDNPLEESIAWLANRRFCLGDVAWCEQHNTAAFERDCDMRLATLELAQTITDADRWDDVIAQPADAQMRINYEAAPQTDPEVTFEHVETGESLEVRPLCCLVDEQTRRNIYANAGGEMNTDSDPEPHEQ